MSNRLHSQHATPSPAPLRGGAARILGGARSVLDGLAYSSGLAAAIGATFAYLASRTLDAPVGGLAACLCGLGVFVIYNVDRLRDTRSDRTTAPLRTAFIEHWRGTLVLALVFASIALAGTLLMAPMPVVWLCVGVGTLGLFHRRLKRRAFQKALYVSIAWVVACVGIPWLNAGQPEHGAWVAAFFTPVLLANLLASNLRDGETQMLGADPSQILAAARAMTLAAAGLVWMAPGALAPFFWIAVAEFTALVFFRADERYGLLVVDGALLIGGLLALAQASG